MVPRTLYTDTHTFTKVNKELCTLVLQNEAGSSICLMHRIKDKCTIFANTFKDFYVLTSEDKWILCLGSWRDRNLFLTPPFNLQKEVLLRLVWFRSTDWLPLVSGEFPVSPRMALSLPSVPAGEGARQLSQGEAWPTPWHTSSSATGVSTSALEIWVCAWRGWVGEKAGVA